MRRRVSKQNRQGKGKKVLLRILFVVILLVLILFIDYILHTVRAMNA